MSEAFNIGQEEICHPGSVRNHRTQRHTSFLDLLNSRFLEEIVVVKPLLRKLLYFFL